MLIFVVIIFYFILFCNLISYNSMKIQNRNKFSDLNADL